MKGSCPIEPWKSPSAGIEPRQSQPLFPVPLPMHRKSQVTSGGHLLPSGTFCPRTSWVFPFSVNSESQIPQPSQSNVSHFKEGTSLPGHKRLDHFMGHRMQKPRLRYPLSNSTRYSGPKDPSRKGQKNGNIGRAICLS